MKKTYSKAELEKKAKDVFKEYSNANSLFATTDGQFFLDQNRANLHAGAKGNVIEIENDFEDQSENKVEAPKKVSKKRSSKKATPKTTAPKDDAPKDDAPKVDDSKKDNKKTTK